MATHGDFLKQLIKLISLLKPHARVPRWYEDLTCTNWINLALIPNVAIRQPGVKLRAAEDYSNRTQLVLG
nr:hypothetical protein Itr_chr14CG12530 [Ipomoea trifida]